MSLLKFINPFSLVKLPNSRRKSFDGTLRSKAQFVILSETLDFYKMTWVNNLICFLLKKMNFMLYCTFVSRRDVDSLPQQ